MVLPELSRTMAYTTHKTVSILARKQLYLSHVVSVLWQHENKENSKMDATFFITPPRHAGSNYNNA